LGLKKNSPLRSPDHARGRPCACSSRTVRSRPRRGGALGFEAHAGTCRHGIEERVTAWVDEAHRSSPTFEREGVRARRAPSAAVLGEAVRLGSRRGPGLPGMGSGSGWLALVGERVQPSSARRCGALWLEDRARVDGSGLFAELRLVVRSRHPVLANRRTRRRSGGRTGPAPWPLTRCLPDRQTVWWFASLRRDQVAFRPS
jgi:hypothetical protein